MRRLWVSLQVAATYMGAVIGAGFASGQELVQFFLNFHGRGYVGLMLAGILFAGFGMLTILLVNYFDARSYTDLTYGIFGKRMGRMLDIWLTFFLFAGLCIMLAGSAAVFVEHLHAPFWLGLLLTCICLGAALLAGSDGVLLFNSCLIPVLMVITILVSLLAIGQETLAGNEIIPHAQAQPGLIGSNWVLAMFLYVSYNMVIGVIVLASLPPQTRDSVLGGFLGGICLGLLGLVMSWAMSHYYPQVLAYEIPMLFIAEHVHPLLKFFYSLVLWFAMLTTALANAFGLAQRLTSVRISYRQAAIGVLLAALPFTKLSFAQLIGNLYPIFGYVGFIVIVGLFAIAVAKIIILPEQ